MTLRNAELLAIGSELLGPWHLDTNGAYLALRLGEIGIAVRFRVVVGDDPADLQAAFRIALSRSDLVIATGGLGPTVDDRTRETLADLLGRPLVENDAIARDLASRYAALGMKFSKSVRRQACVPEGAEVLPNSRGSAPGLLLKAGEALIALLPGVPAEMRQMVEEHLLPRLASGSTRIARRTLKIFGLGESEVDRRLESVARGAGDLGWTILGSPGQISIHLSEPIPEGSPAGRIDKAERQIRAILGERVFAVDDESMEEVVGRLLVESNSTLAVAESMTGGGLARAITAVSGSSRYFLGGVVCYSDRVKREAVGVRPETLTRYRAVSGEVAAELATGIRTRLEATWGLSVTGFAGPTAIDDRPPGTVYIGLSGPGLDRTASFSFPGDRLAVRERAVQGSLDLLRRALLGLDA